MADLVTVQEIDYVAIDSVENQILEIDGDRVSIVETTLQLVEPSSTSVELVVTNEPQNIVYTSDPISYISDAGGTAGVTIYDEGGLVAKNVTELNFIGSLVTAKDVNSKRANIFIPQPSYMSHFNTTDGLNDCSIADVTVFNRLISLPTNEGNPFSIGDWSTGQIHQVVSSGTLVYQTPSPCSLFDESTTFTITIFGSDGVTPLTQFTTPTISGNGVFISQDSASTCTVNGWGADVDKYQAQISIVVNIALLLPTGGRFGVSIQHTNSSDGVFIKAQNHLFYDPNPYMVNVGGITISESNINSFRYLSGIRYYSFDDAFTIDISGLDYLNANSYPQPFVLVQCTEYGIPDIQVNSSDLINWTPQWDNKGATFTGTASIDTPGLRFIGEAYVSTAVLDWGVAKSATSTMRKILLDTYPRTSTDQIEYFDDEYYRQDSTFASGASYGNWSSANPLQPGEALVCGGYLSAPSVLYTIDDKPQQLVTDLYNYYPHNPDGTNNPDYSGMQCPVDYYRTFMVPSHLNEVMTFQIYVDGEFIGANVNEDIQNGYIEIYIRRMYSDMGGNYGFDCPPLTVHGWWYDPGSFDDGVTNGCIRLGNSTDDMIAVTAGGLSVNQGIYFHIRLLDSRIRIDTIRLEFN